MSMSLCKHLMCLFFEIGIGAIIRLAMVFNVGIGVPKNPYFFLEFLNAPLCVFYMTPCGCSTNQSTQLHTNRSLMRNGRGWSVKDQLPMAEGNFG